MSSPSLLLFDSPVVVMSVQTVSSRLESDRKEMTQEFTSLKTRHDGLLAGQASEVRAPSSFLLSHVSFFLLAHFRFLVACSSSAHVMCQAAWIQELIEQTEAITTSKVSPPVCIVKYQDTMTSWQAALIRERDDYARQLLLAKGQLLPSTALGHASQVREKEEE